MADNQHLNLLISGVKQWNQWRSDNPNVTIDLSNAELSEFNFGGFNLNNVNLSRANLTRAIFFKTILSQVNLESSNLSSAKIITNLDNVDLSQATLNDTVLINLPNRGNEKNALLRQKESILQQLIGLGNQKWDIDRVIWRAGELKIKEATPLLVKLISTGKPLRDYCIAWALGWCGDATVIPHLQLLLNNPQQPDFVHRIAFEAILKLADTQTQNQLRLAQINQLPQSLKTIVKKGNSGKLIQKLQEYLTTEKANFNVINTLYQIDNNIARSALINFITTAPFAENYFRQIRQLFKIAEYRLDAEVLGILTYRFEKELTNEIYSQKSKTYLQKRIWRILKELAEKEIILDEQPKPDLYKSDYVLIAIEILLSYDDEDAEQIRNTGKGRLYDVYARYLIFNHILYENSHRYILKPNNKAWQCQSDYQIESPPPRVREEAFPELWSANPNMLVRLLSESNCQPVHHFAVTALRDCSEFLLHIQVNNIIKFLAKSYQETQEFALELARILYNSQQPNLELLTALINCDLEIARNLVLDWVSQQPKYFLSQPQFIVNLLVSPYLNIRSFVKNLIKSTRLTDSKKIALVNEIIAKLITFELNDSAIAIELLNLLLEDFTKYLERLPMNLIRGLVASNINELRDLGISIFIKLPENIIIQDFQIVVETKNNLSPDNFNDNHNNSILSLIIAYQDLVIYQKIKPILIKIGKKHSDFIITLVNYIVITDVREIKTFEFVLELIESVNISVAEYPFSIINSLLYSGYESIQLGGINLFAQLSDDVILEHEQVFLDLINYNKTNLNNALQAIIKRLASEYNDFVIKLIKELIIKFSEEDIKILVLNLLRTIAFPANESTFNLMEFLLASNQEELKVTAVNIFEKLPDDTLLKHQNIFIELITNDSTIVLDAMSSFLKKFINKYCQFVIEIIEKLLSKESTEKSQLLVANLLLKITGLSNADGKDTQNEGSREMDSVNNPDFLVTYIPFHIIEFLVNSQFETVTKIGIDIFAQLPTQIIIQHQSIVAKFIVHKNHIFRESIQGAIAQAGNNLYFILQTIPPLIKLLVKKETFTGIHEYIISILKGSLSESVFYISKIDTDKLIKSNYKLAQELGSLSLENNYQKFVKEYEIKEIIILANHELLNVRQVAWKMMELKLYRIHKNHQDKLAAVRLLESSWDDSRQFAQDLFSNNFHEEDWTADVMITICDSIKEDVRTFGKELVKQYFRDARGEEYLLKFSEHPSADIQLLATDYLHDFASDNEDNLAQLEPYFNTILSQVNKGRTAKNKVFDFLLKEAEKSEHYARIVADILNRQSLTMAITDKAKIIQIMMKIKKQYPTITLPLEVKQVSEIRS